MDFTKKIETILLPIFVKIFINYIHFYHFLLFCTSKSIISAISIIINNILNYYACCSWMWYVNKEIIHKITKIHLLKSVKYDLIVLKF